MTCQELCDILHDFISGELVVEKHRTVEVHLSKCRNCVTLVETYKYTIKLARALPKCQRLPQNVEERLRKVLEPHLKNDGKEEKQESANG